MLRIVSGGQTGVDRAALDAAAELGLPSGGWCPAGRRAEDGPIDPRYPLVETPSRDYRERTAWNVRDSDATLILTRGAVDRGTALTLKLAQQRGQPVLVVDVSRDEDVDVPAWLERHAVATLNVAGPRESRAPGMHAAALTFLRRALASSPGG